MMENNNKQAGTRLQQVQMRITQLLNVSPQQYNAYKMRCGRAFLQNIIPNYPQLIDEIIEKQIYWQWWEDHYLLRDEVFLNADDIHLIHPEILGAMYSTLHNPYALSKELVVDSMVFEGLSFNSKGALE
jgi:hypothetical protein